MESLQQHCTPVLGLMVFLQYFNYVWVERLVCLPFPASNCFTLPSFIPSTALTNTPNKAKTSVEIENKMN